MLVADPDAAADGFHTAGWGQLGTSEQVSMH